MPITDGSTPTGIAWTRRDKPTLGLLGSTALSLSLATGAAFTFDQALAQQVVAPGTERHLSEGEEVIYSGTAPNSAIRVQNGATLTGTGAIISTSGTFTSSAELSSGVRADAASTVDLTGGTISATGAQFTRGILGFDGASITTNGTAISTMGDNSHGVHVLNGATALIQGGTISTQGSDSFGLSSQNAGTALTTQDVAITTGGFNGFGAFAFGGGSIYLNGGSIATNGGQGHGAVAGANSHIGIVGTSIETAGNQARGLIADQANTSIAATGDDIVTRGLHAYGVHAQAAGPDTAAIVLDGGSILTANETGRGTQQGDGARGYALYANGGGASISANGTTIRTLGQRSYGAYAVDGATIGLDDLSISTEGFMAYGVYASGAGSLVTANNVNITTTGQVGDAAWAYNGGRLELNGGTYHVHGAPNPTAGETANGLMALGGTAGVNDGVIVAEGLTLITEGTNSRGLMAGARVGSTDTSGQIYLSGSSVAVNGANAVVGEVSYGSVLGIEGSVLASRRGAGIRLVDSATVTLNSTQLSAAQATFLSNLNSAGQTQQITLGAGSVATANNGTLLQVDRTAAGGDGVVNLTLGAGSTSRGDIVDDDEKTGGGTDVTLEQGATWTGLLRGVRNFFGGAGGEVSFEGEADIQGDLTGDGTSYVFSDQGGRIAGSVFLGNGSQTTGGTIANRINVEGDAEVDETSVLGGNWNIAGNLTNAGVVTPGNSIGRVSVGGDLLLAPTSVYEVDIDATGDADLIEVAGTATLDGAVAVTPLGGFLVGSPYTILTAGTLAGSFDSVSFPQPSAFLDASLSYEPNSVLLTIARNDVDFASVGETPNQRAVAEALDRLPLTNPLAGAIALGGVSDAVQAFDQLSGEIHASAKTALVEGSGHIRDAANARIRAAFGGTAATPLPVLSYGPTDGSELDAATGPSYEAAGWASVFGSWGSTGGNGNAAELDRSIGGFIVGVDGMVTDTWRIGALAGYSRTSFDVDDRASSGSADSFHLGLYGGTQWGAVAFRTGLAYGWHNVETSRSVDFPGFSDDLTASYDAGTFQAFAELGYDVTAGDVALEPFANVAYVNHRTGSYAETGGAAALFSPGRTSDTAFTTLGVRAATAFKVVGVDMKARGMIGWRHAFGDTTPVAAHAFAEGGSFTVAGASIARNAALVEIGFDVGLTPTATLGLGYAGQFASNASDHGIRAEFKMAF